MPVPHQTFDLATPERVVLASFLEPGVAGLTLNQLFRTDSPFHRRDKHRRSARPDGEHAYRHLEIRGTETRFANFEKRLEGPYPFPRGEDGSDLASRSFKRRDSVLL